MSDRTSLKSILLLAANPKGTQNLRLQEEEREIKEQLRIAGYGKIPINSSGATRPRDIHQAMLDWKPQVVHFSGHGAGKEGLVFEDGNGQEKLVGSEALANFFRLFTSRYPIECVVLNACYSEFQAQAIARHVDYVIGMSKAIRDRAAIEFSVGFYKALGAGESFEFAYELGCNAIELEGIPEYLTPIIWAKGQLIDTRQSNLTPKTQVLNPRGKDVAPIQEQITADKEAEDQPPTSPISSKSLAETDDLSSEHPVDFTSQNIRVRCPSCNHLNPQGTPQCEVCYTPLPNEICPSCSASIPPGNKFCNQCGFNLTLVKPKKETRQARQKLDFGSSGTRDSDSFSERSTDDLSSERGVNYTNLRDLLASGQWREADQETVAVMLKAANREKERYLDTKSIEEFPCTDLRTIDQLWVKYSNGRFGLSVQKRIWESVGGKPGEYDYEIYKKFADRVGWLIEEINEEKRKEDVLIYDLNNAPKGHLPGVFFLRGGRVLWWLRGRLWRAASCSSLASRLVNCNI
jgi:predicted nucleic acid-binding Zn ribbon protein